MLSFLFVTCFLVALAQSSPISPSQLESRAVNEVVQGKLGTDGWWNRFDGGLNQYIFYSGDGSSGAGWPTRREWLSFNDMWTANTHVMARSCNLYYNTSNNSPDEMQSLWNAIQTVSQQTLVDHRFILAAIMQETRGCVRAKTTVSPDGTVRNPGLLQDHDGPHSCNDNGNVQNPCPNDQILGMVEDGVAGTAKGNGLAGTITSQNENMEFAQAYYRAARLYNSGAIDPSGDLGKGSATHCYASDIANRMVGWVDAPSRCSLDLIGM